MLMYLAPSSILPPSCRARVGELDEVSSQRPSASRKQENYEWEGRQAVYWILSGPNCAYGRLNGDVKYQDKNIYTPYICWVSTEQEDYSGNQLALHIGLFESIVVRSRGLYYRTTVEVCRMTPIRLVSQQAYKSASFRFVLYMTIDQPPPPEVEKSGCSAP